MTWRQSNHLTDWEFAEAGALLCDHEPRDLALMVIRLRAQLAVCEQLRKVSVPLDTDLYPTRCSQPIMPHPSTVLEFK